MIKAVLLLSLAVVVASDDAASTSTAQSSSGSAEPPPHAPPAPPPPAVPPFGGGFPGFGGGFHKNFNFNAGAGYGLGGLSPALLGGLLGGAGGPPPDGEIPPPVGGFPGFGGFGPGYLPQTWVGSALGAKGDLLFPIVIFVFFIVGIWTVIQFLLAFIVPLIAKKLAIDKGILATPFIKREVFTPTTVQQPDLEFITTTVMNAINEPKCLQYVACHTGNFLNSMAGGGDRKAGNVKDYEGILKALSSMTKSPAIDLFERAFVSGTQDCSDFTCNDSTSATPSTSKNATTSASNHL